MPDCPMRYKAGKLSFLLVCLFLCTACGKEKVVFETKEITTEVNFEEEKTTQETADQITVSEPVVNDEKIQLVNINTADAQTLMTLPGIGETRAAAIIEYRQQEGEFETIEDIMNVKGIKTGIFSKINKLICVK